MEEARDRGDERGLSRARGTRIVLEPKPEVKFAWVDGIFWERWVKTTYGIDVTDGEKVVIIDEEVSNGFVHILHWETDISTESSLLGRNYDRKSYRSKSHKYIRNASEGTS
jgi:protein disulfide-isomerase